MTLLSRHSRTEGVPLGHALGGNLFGSPMRTLGDDDFLASFPSASGEIFVAHYDTQKKLRVIPACFWRESP